MGSFAPPHCASKVDLSPLKQGLHPVPLLRVVEPHAVDPAVRGRGLPEVARSLAREHEVVLQPVHLERLGDPLGHVVEAQSVQDHHLVLRRAGGRAKGWGVGGMRPGK